MIRPPLSHFSFSFQYSAPSSDVVLYLACVKRSKRSVAPVHRSIRWELAMANAYFS